jgi:hypothetical protein
MFSKFFWGISVRLGVDEESILNAKPVFLFFYFEATPPAREYVLEHFL